MQTTVERCRNLAARYANRLFNEKTGKKGISAKKIGSGSVLLGKARVTFYARANSRLVSKAFPISVVRARF